MELGRVKRIKLGSQGLEVSAQGLGCLGMASSNHSKPEEDLIKLIHHAICYGVTFLDTSDFYGPHTSEILIGKALKGGWREKVQLATKFGIKSFDGNTLDACGEPSYVRTTCEASLKRLGVDYIDLYYVHRIDTRIPIEITMGELKKLVEEDKIKYIGLSEACVSTIKRAHAIHPITAVQIEWSLWSRDVEEKIIPTCRELGIGIVAYSPLRKGFFSVGSKIIEKSVGNELQKCFPRFEPKNMEINKKIFNKVNEMAKKKGCTPSQLALAWVHHQGNDVSPIPGTTKIENFNQNVGALFVHLTTKDMVELESLATIVKGDRFRDGIITWRDSETPPLSSWIG